MFDLYENAIVQDAHGLFAGRWNRDEVLVDCASCPFDVPTARLEWRPDQGVDHWQLPSTTELTGGGDCEDLALHWLGGIVHSCVINGALAPETNVLALVVGKLADGRHHAVGEWSTPVEASVYFDCRKGISSRLDDFKPQFWLELWPGASQKTVLKWTKRRKV